MRIVKNPRTPLERQTWESIKIDSLTVTNNKGCLNLNSEWGQSKNPSPVTRPSPKAREEPVPLNKRPKMEEDSASGREEAPRRKRFRSSSLVIT